MSDSNRAPTRVLVYVLFVVGLGLAGLVASAYLERVRLSSYPVDVVGLLAFLVVALGLELARHELVMGAVTGSIAFIIYLPAAVVFGPTLCAVIGGVSVAVALSVKRRSSLKIVFNVGQHVLALILAGGAYLALGGVIAPASLDSVPVPFFGLALTYLIINTGAVSGVVALAERRQFSEVWLRNTWGLVTYDLLASAFGLAIAWVYLEWRVAGLAAVVLPILFLRHTYLVNLQLQATYRELLELMVKSIEARDPYTSGHSQRVSELARAIAREMGLHLREVDNIATAALLHDVGKIYQEFAPILRKEGKLTSEERAIMNSHPVRSAELVGTISSLRGYVEKCVRHHHENFDGTGYPDGLSGNEIPVGARIVLVADTTDAMTTDRPYRKALTYERVVEELAKFAGRQFDPLVVAAFKRSSMIRRTVAGGRQAQETPVFAQAGRREQLAAR